MVGYNTVQGVGGQRFLLTTIEAQFLMKKLCLARRFHESPAAPVIHEISGLKIVAFLMQRRSIYE
jgi:hypothetical protein